MSSSGGTTPAELIEQLNQAALNARAALESVPGKELSVDDGDGLITLQRRNGATAVEISRALMHDPERRRELEEVTARAIDGLVAALLEDASPLVAAVGSGMQDVARSELQPYLEHLEQTYGRVKEKVSEAQARIERRRR